MRQERAVGFVGGELGGGSAGRKVLFSFSVSDGSVCEWPQTPRHSPNKVSGFIFSSFL